VLAGSTPAPGSWFQTFYEIEGRLKVGALWVRVPARNLPMALVRGSSPQQPIRFWLNGEDEVGNDLPVSPVEPFFLLRFESLS